MKAAGARATAVAVILPLAMSAGACGSAPATSSSSGVEWSVVPGPVMPRIRSPVAALASVADIADDGRGRTYIVDDVAATIFVIDTTGAVLHTLGEPRTGPDGLERPTAIGFRVDTVWVLDVERRRVEMFDSLGRRVGGRSARPISTRHGQLTLGALLGNENTAAVSAVASGSSNASRSVVLMDGGRSPRTVLGEYSVRSAQLRMERAGKSFRIYNPFATAGSWAVSSNGSAVVVADVDSTLSALRLTLHDADGETLFASTVHAPDGCARTVQARDSLSSLLRGMGFASGEASRMAAGVAPRRQRQLPYSVLIGPDSTVWVGWEGATSVQWHVHEANGTQIGTVTLPLPWRALEISADRIWAVAPGPSGVPSIRWFRYARAPAGSAN